MLKTEDLVEDEYYSTLNNFNKKTVFICGNKQQTYKFWLSEPENFKLTDSWNGDIIKNNLKLANNEEKHWLNECIKANKFIPYEEAMKTFKEESLAGRYAKFKSNWNTLGNHHCYKPIDFNKTYKIDCIGNFKFKNCSGKCVIIDEIYKNAYIPVEVLDIMPEGWTPEQEKPQYEVGKWYTHSKWFKGTYIKFHSIRDNNSVNRTEIISNYIFRKEINWSISYEHTLIPVDLSEIQQYLPDGHVDKFPIESEKPIYEVVHCTTQEEWNFVLNTLPKDCALYKKKNKFNKYISTYSEGIGVEWAGKSYCGLDWFREYKSKIYSFQEWCNKFGHKPYSISKKEEYKVGSYVIVNNLTGVSSNAKIGSLAIITRQPYNENCFINNVGIDVKWINLKDENGNSIQLNNQNDGAYSLSMFRLALPHEIPQEINNSVPEYVECIEDAFPNVGVIKGTIWKTDTKGYPKGEYRIVWEDGSGQMTKKYEHCFKPSTKKAFENQLKQYPLTPKECISNSNVIEIGDEIELLTSSSHNSCSKWYNHKIAFKQEDIGSKLIILDYEDIDGGAYKVETPRGYTALRKSAFKLIKKASQTTLLNKKVDGISPVKVNTKLLDIIKIKGSTPTKVEKKRIKLTILKTKQLNLN